MSRTLSRLRNEHGAAAVEFAFVLVPLSMLLLGTVYFGITMFKWQGMQAAAREGARIGSLTTTTTAVITSRVLDSLPSNVSATPAPVITVRNSAGVETSAPPVPCNSINKNRSVIVTMNRAETVKILAVTHAFTLTGKGEFRCEGAGATP